VPIGVLPRESMVASSVEILIPPAARANLASVGRKVTIATIKQIRANRLNARKSTGPKTGAGKQRSRFNGLVHGLRTECAVLPGEDQD